VGTMDGNPAIDTREKHVASLRRGHEREPFGDH